MSAWLLATSQPRRKRVANEVGFTLVSSVGASLRVIYALRLDQFDPFTDRRSPLESQSELADKFHWLCRQVQARIFFPLALLDGNRDVPLLKRAPGF